MCVPIVAARGWRRFQRCPSRKALAPLVRIVGGMEYGVDRNPRLQPLVEHGIWKATYQRAAAALMNDGENRGSTPDAFQTRIDRTQELLTESSSSAVLPNVGLRNLQLGFRRDHQINGRSGHAPGILHLPRAVPKPGSSVDSLSGVPVPASANRAPARPQVRQRGRPTSLRQGGVSRKGLGQKSTLDSLGSPLPVLSNWRATWMYHAPPKWSLKPGVPNFETEDRSCLSPSSQTVH